LVNEVVIPLALKDAFNSINPVADAGIQAVVDKVNDPILPKVIQQVYGIPAPAAPRTDLFEIFLTGIAANNGANGPIQADLNSQLVNDDVIPGNFRPSEMLRLNMAIPVAASPSRLGVLTGDFQGFPNGFEDLPYVGLAKFVGFELHRFGCLFAHAHPLLLLVLFYFTFL